MKKLTKTMRRQLEALRDHEAGKPTGSVRVATMQALIERGLATARQPGDEGWIVGGSRLFGRYRLTDAGREALQEP